jgi:hypothetical protein
MEQQLYLIENTIRIVLIGESAMTFLLQLKTITIRDIVQTPMTWLLDWETSKKKKSWPIQRGFSILQHGRLLE